MRRLPFLAIALLLCSTTISVADDADPPGWTTTVRRIEGSERRLWHLALVSHESSRHVTLVVTPVARAGAEVAVIDGERVERSESGDLHQIALWAERLRQDAEGWKRPSLRDRPPASAHVIGVVCSVEGRVMVQNAEHGGGELTVGDLLFVEDVFACDGEGGVGIEMMGSENLWHHRSRKAELAFGRGARIGLRGGSDDLTVRVHEGRVTGRTDTDDLRLRTDRDTYAPDKASAFLLTCAQSDHLAVRAGTVVVGEGATKMAVAGGSALDLLDGGARRVTPLDEARWEEDAPREPSCTRGETLRLVERVHGQWRGEPRTSMLTLDDDGRWNGYERHPGRSVKKAGSWEPRRGGLVELVYEWTPHRSTTKRRDVYRYLLDGAAFVRLRPGSPVFLRTAARD